MFWGTDKMRMTPMILTMAVIQLQLNRILFSPSSRSLAAIFISDSATAILAEAAGLISAMVDFSPYDYFRVSGPFHSCTINQIVLSFQRYVPLPLTPQTLVLA